MRPYKIGVPFFLLCFVSIGVPGLSAQFVADARLVGEGAIPLPAPLCDCPSTTVAQGSSVAIAADGNAAIIGGPGDNNSALGAAWVFTRLHGVWNHNSEKLIGAGGANNIGFIESVAISADGNTALLGRGGDNNGVGAVWVFVRVNGSWSQQGEKLIGSDSIGPYQAQGAAVAISADGNTAVFDGRGDNVNTGAVWVFTRNKGVWTQDGEKLTAADGKLLQGFPAISADGSTILFWGSQGNGTNWIFTRQTGVWQLQGALIGSGLGGSVYQGGSSALSTDGNTAIIGGYDRIALAAYAWIFTRQDGVWVQQGPRLVASQPLSFGPVVNNDVSLSADGNTALVNTSIFTRDGTGTWREPEQLDLAALPGPAAISGDAHTVIVGNPGEGNGAGAAWIFLSKRRAACTSASGGAICDAADRNF